MTKKRVLLLGLLPEVVDFSGFPGLDADKLAKGLAAQEKSLCDLGFDAKWCLFDRGETALSVVGAELDGGAWDVVLVGAGIRTQGAHFVLFEQLVNLVHERAPKARICFNTKPGDTEEAVLRWVPRPSTSG